MSEFQFSAAQKVQKIDTIRYLDRLDLQPEIASLSFLKKLHKAHLLSVPFENLDIHYGPNIVVDVERIYEKVIEDTRGGFCYELNVLFFHLLANLGFACTLASAQVKKNDGWGPEFDHVVILVKVSDEVWLADVGFGKLFVEPKKLAFNNPQLDYNTYFRFETDPDDNWILKKSKDNSVYNSIYRTDLKARQMIEFIPMCNWHQESEASMFSQNKLITKLFPNGRITLTDRKLILELNGELEERPIANEDEFLAKLGQHFGYDTRKLITQRFS